MSYAQSNLVPGETVIYETRLHWIVMLGHLAVGCLLLSARFFKWDPHRPRHARADRKA